MQQVTMITDRHKENSQASRVRLDGDINIRQISPTLQMNLLGTFLIASDHIPLTSIEVPRLQSLLAYLVLHRGVPQSRTSLASMLWPDSTEEQAHTNLRNLLYKLRQALPDSEQYLIVNRHMLMWQDNDCWTMDVQEFEQAVNIAEQAELMEDYAMARQALANAMELYRGNLLPGCYDEWILQERERLSQMYLGVIEKLLHLQEREGDLQGAIRIAQRLLREDPLQEGSYRHLMRLYANSGNRAAAVRAYQNCVAVLKRELGVEPGPETHQAYEQLIHLETATQYATTRRSKIGLEAFETLRPKQFSLCEYC
ncbi:MAG TPA: BTAD domain-containing putative transcriptional regulator [Ktedonobacteraceae bacterium]|nr:BTAD domain-containing putative transcriptional regulator [Ktedonobacteraceae bacterium]